MQPITYQEFCASEAARLEDWRRRFRMNADFAAARAECRPSRPRWARRGGPAPRGDHPEHRRPAPACRASRGIADRDPRQFHARTLPRLPRADVARRGAQKSSTRRARRRAAPAAAWSRRRSSPSASACRRGICCAPRSSRPRRRSLPGHRLVAAGAARRVAAACGAAAPAHAWSLINSDATPLDQAADLIVRASIGAVFSALYPQLVNERASEQ